MESFNKQLAIYLVGTSQENIVKPASKLINKCQKSDFDITFPSASKIDLWRKCTNKKEPELSFEGLLKIEQDLDNHKLSDQFSWPIINILTKNDAVYLKLDRHFVIKSTVAQICSSGIIDEKCASSKAVCIVNSELQRSAGKTSSRQLNQLRANQIWQALTRLLAACNHNIVPQSETQHVIRIGCSDTRHLKQSENDIPLKVGQVKIKNNDKFKECYTLTEVYTVICDKMKAIANERDSRGSNYDIRKQSQIIAAAELQMLLLSRNIDRQIVLQNIEDEGELATEASFILYNYARINQLVQSFEAQKEKYGNLLSIEDTEFSHLTEPEEWDIIINVIIPYIDMITTLRDIQINETSFLETLNRCLTHLCAHISKLSNIYSKYYRRVKVLKEGIHGTSAIQTLNARMYFIYTIKIVYEHAFEILGIKPVKYM